MAEEDSIGKVNLDKLIQKQDMVEAGLITEQGLRIQGMGLVLKKLDQIKELLDKTNLKLHFIEKKLEK